MKYKVMELFAGVGGFRLGLGEEDFDYVFYNQWEPSKKKQWAYEIYKENFNQDHKYANVDIAKIPVEELPDCDILVGGFPCQDYSVAKPNTKSLGIEGEKGVLWWNIYNILEAKQPKIVLLENVDRLLKSPSKQPGRDFSIILWCFNRLGYNVWWNVVDSSKMKAPQRRKRVYIYAVRQDLDIVDYNSLTLTHDRVLLESLSYQTFKDIQNITLKYKDHGVMFNGLIFNRITQPIELRPTSTLRSVLDKNVAEKYYLTDEQIESVIKVKSAKSIEREKNGHKYTYREGAMATFDDLDKPSRTLLTSEGSISRTSHFIVDPETNKPRKLTPEECEALQQFPKGWTKKAPDSVRYFLMGNALVTGIVKHYKQYIINILEDFNDRK